MHHKSRRGVWLRDVETERGAHTARGKSGDWGYDPRGVRVRSGSGSGVSGCVMGFYVSLAF
jgi:hypothetical protein